MWVAAQRGQTGSWDGKTGTTATFECDDAPSQPQQLVAPLLMHLAAWMSSVGIGPDICQKGHRWTNRGEVHYIVIG